MCFFFFKQKTAYEMRISNWSSDVCSSDLRRIAGSIITVTAIEIDGVWLCTWRRHACAFNRIAAYPALADREASARGFMAVVAERWHTALGPGSTEDRRLQGAIGTA